MDTAQILLNAQSANPELRKQAERILSEACQSNFSNFLTTLSTHLSTETANPESRRLAGLIMKNNLSSHSTVVQRNYTQRWFEKVEPPAREKIHGDLLGALGSGEGAARRAGAQVIASLAVIELPVKGGWPDLIGNLLKGSMADVKQGGEKGIVLRQASLETLGFICEEASFSDNGDCAKALEEDSNSILNAVVGNMSFNEGGHEQVGVVRLSATMALNNAIEFAKKNFEVKEERQMIMIKLYEAAKSEDTKVRQLAYEGLVRVAECYYEYLVEYISGIHDVSIEAIKTDQENVALQAIEFWCTVADEEVAIAEEVDAAKELQGEANGSVRAVEDTSKHFIREAVPTLVGPLFECLKVQSEDPDDDTWNRATASASCLESMAGAAPEVILQPVITFVDGNLENQNDWRCREAAVMAFGSILEGPSPSTLQEFVAKALPPIIKLMVDDPHVAVQDTAAWTLGRMVKVSEDVTKNNLNYIMEGIRAALVQSKAPIVAGHVCFATHNVAEMFRKFSSQTSGPLGPYMEVLLRELLNTSARDDASEASLRINAFEAINELFRASAADSLSHVKACFPVLLEKLEATIQAASEAFSEDDAMEITESQGLLCSALTTATQRLQSVGNFADRMMNCYMAILTSKRSGAVTEEALLAVGAVADALGDDFVKYLPHFAPIVVAAVKKHEQSSLCKIAVGVIGDLSRSLGPHLKEYAQQIMVVLLDALQSDVVEQTAKPPILSCIGDVALGIREAYADYVPEVMKRLEAAALKSMKIQVEPEDYDMQEFLVALKEAVFEAYIGIVNGLREGGKQNMLVPFVEWMVGFCAAIEQQNATSKAPTYGASVLKKKIAEVLGDLGDISEPVRKTIANQPWVKKLVDDGVRSKDSGLRQRAEYAKSTIYVR